MDEPSNEQTGQAGTPGQGAFSQDDIDALLQGGGDAASDSAGSTQSDAGTPPAESGAISQADIDALMGAPGGSGAGEGVAEEVTPASSAPPEAETAPDTRVDTLGRPFDEAAAAMEAAIAEERAATESAGAPPGAPPDAAGDEPQTQQFQLADLGDEEPVEIDHKRVTMLNDVDLPVRLQLGKTRMLVEDVLKLGEGSVVELDKLAGDPIDVLINGRLIARGEVLVLNDVFCVRISEVLAHDPHRVTT